MAGASCHSGTPDTNSGDYARKCGRPVSEIQGRAGRGVVPRDLLSRSMGDHYQLVLREASVCSLLGGPAEGCSRYFRRDPSSKATAYRRGSCHRPNRHAHHARGSMACGRRGMALHNCGLLCRRSQALQRTVRGFSVSFYKSTRIDVDNSRVERG